MESKALTEDIEKLKDKTVLLVFEYPIDLEGEDFLDKEQTHTFCSVPMLVHIDKISKVRIHYHVRKILVTDVELEDGYKYYKDCLKRHHNIDFVCSKNLFMDKLLERVKKRFLGAKLGHEIRWKHDKEFFLQAVKNVR